ncbi:hypothetical protein DSM104329_03171 [Capillimicrobium parvum]|uniref:Uncharacterized protein n=2 Tax=Capillimicrobium parvum TaxID=2884022 RepID=A0A9E6XYS2_9ACTN|nr:hypothetical protein DSM104329_03171 [Capillimicrobium parvum]
MDELVFASDSRLSGGQRWDGCPKILTLPRSDALMSFAGETQAAYPMMLQLANSIAFYPPSQERRLDLAHLGGHSLRLFNQMRGLIDGPFAVGQTEPDPPRAVFLLGGYSWRYRAFFTWKLEFAEGEFRYRRVVRGRQSERGWHFHFAGDTDAVELARNRLFELLRAPGRERVQADGLDMEPFEVLRDVIREARFDSVGGPPQVAKVYRHLNTQFFAVEWQNVATIAGRPALSYEQAFIPRLDADRPDLQPRPPERLEEPLPGETEPTADETVE